MSSAGHVARFVFKPRDLYANGVHAGLPKQSAFSIDKHPETGELEVSVCGLTDVSPERLWRLGATIREQESLTAIAALRMGVQPVETLGLKCKASPIKPHFAEHGVIVGWPSGDDQKSARDDLKNGLVALVTKADVLRP